MLKDVTFANVLPGECFLEPSNLYTVWAKVVKSPKMGYNAVCMNGWKRFDDDYKIAFRGNFDECWDVRCGDSLILQNETEILKRTQNVSNG